MSLVRALRRLARWYGRLRGEAGRRCGGCGGLPPPDERLCLECWASHAAAP